MVLAADTLRPALDEGLQALGLPLSQAPSMMPPMLSKNSQKNWVGGSASNSPRKAGALNT